MTITINGKDYTIIRDAEIEYRSSRVNPTAWVSMYLSDETVTDEYGDNPKYIAWYYVEDLENTDLDSIDYESPHDIETVR